MAELKIGDRVTRKGNHMYEKNKGLVGTVIALPYPNKAQVKWDKKASNGQQHSTLDFKVLIKV